MVDTVYVVTAGDYSAYHIERVYLDKEEAEQYVAAANLANPRYFDVFMVEEYQVGAPPGEMDGPIWEATWSRSPDSTAWLEQYGTWPKNSDHPALGPYSEWESIQQVWHTGEIPPKAEVTRREVGQYSQVIVRGTSKDHVEKALYDNVAQARAEIYGIT